MLPRAPAMVIRHGVARDAMRERAQPLRPRRLRGRGRDRDEDLLHEVVHVGGRRATRHEATHLGAQRAPRVCALVLHVQHVGPQRDFVAAPGLLARIDADATYSSARLPGHELAMNSRLVPTTSTATSVKPARAGIASTSLTVAAPEIAVLRPIPR